MGLTYRALPSRTTLKTFTRGAMVRKKASREQLEAVRVGAWGQVQV
jgi:hypothetical protein